MAKHVYLLIVSFIINILYYHEMVECLPSTLDMDKLPIVRIKLSEQPLSKIIEGNLRNFYNI